MEPKSLSPILRKMKETLEAMDAIAADEETEDICAEIEDLILFIESIDFNDADATEELDETLRQISETLASIHEEGEITSNIKVMETLTLTALNDIRP